MKTLKEKALVKVAGAAKEMARTSNGAASAFIFHQPQVPAKVKALKKK
ncbi:MAG: AgrD family cyclic lactone autoinducer peptide [Cellulosilyticaceae bacterium]